MKIVLAPAPVLDQVCQPVVFDQETAKLARRLQDEMVRAKGIGLAAPQIGVSKRAFVMKLAGWPTVCLNPEFTDAGAEVVSQEGCLSFPGIFLRIRRPASIVASWFSIDGARHTRRLDALDARCFQHELDHLNGVTFDRRTTAMAFQMAKAQRRA